MEYKEIMKGLLLTVIILIISSCAPVLRPETMEIASRDVPLSAMREDPSAYLGKLYVMGGIIIETKFTEEGSLIEALYVPVDSRGYLRSLEESNGRFLALFPKESGHLDPLLYRKGREITLSGEFIGLRKGRLDEIEYTYPLFEIREIYLWPRIREYYYMPPPYYPPPPFYPYPYWWRYYPYPYW
jgi:outer membrane lipoprotein